MEFPLRREALRKFAASIDEEERRLAERESPEVRFKLALALSQLARSLARSAGGTWLNEPEALTAKARLYAAPLRAALGKS